MTRNLALYFGRYDVRVNAVAPGPIASTLTADGQDALSPEVRDVQRRATALGRVGDLAEVAAVVAPLASDEASYVTGAIILVDGGFISGIRGCRTERISMTSRREERQMEDRSGTPAGSNPGSQDESRRRMIARGHRTQFLPIAETHVHHDDVVTMP